MSNTATSTEQRAEFTFPTEKDAVTWVETLADSPAFCDWCFAPLYPNPLIQFPGEPEARPLQTSGAYAEFGNPAKDVPPDKKDAQGNVLEHSRSKFTICDSCGVVDPAPEDTRPNETVQEAAYILLTILLENDVGINPFAAQQTITEAFADRRSGQACQVLGEAIYEATPDS